MTGIYLIGLRILALFLIFQSCEKHHVNDILIGGEGVRSKSRFQKLVFADEFNGPEPGDNLECFSIEPVCVNSLTHLASGQCPENMNTNNLKLLNKCNWRVWNGVGFWDSSKRSNYHPNQISVMKQNGQGFLRLTGNYQPREKYDCGYFSNEDQRRNCPFDFGGVDSQFENDLVKGRSFTYGRLEIRARISHHQNLFPALWTWPQRIGTGYPHRAYVWRDVKVNEIDLLESFGEVEGKFDVFQSFHDWECGPKAREAGVTHCNIFNSKHTFNLKRNEWYIYGVERDRVGDKDVIRLYINDMISQTITDGDRAPTGRSLQYKNFFEVINRTPHLIKMNIISGFKGKFDLEKMDNMYMDIDWVRIYEE